MARLDVGEKSKSKRVPKSGAWDIGCLVFFAEMSEDMGMSKGWVSWDWDARYIHNWVCWVSRTKWESKFQVKVKDGPKPGSGRLTEIMGLDDITRELSLRGNSPQVGAGDTLTSRVWQGKWNLTEEFQGEGKKELLAGKITPMSTLRTGKFQKATFLKEGQKS